MRGNVPTRPTITVLANWYVEDNWAQLFKTLSDEEMPLGIIVERNPEGANAEDFCNMVGRLESDGLGDGRRAKKVVEG